MKPWLLAPILIVLDQVTKYMARKYLVGHIVPLFFGGRLQIAFNDGFAFSLPAPQIILIILALGVSGFLIYWSRAKERAVFEIWAAVFVASGAVGNAIDRLLFSEVTDFFAFWNFPIFNIADICVSLGVAFLLLGEFVAVKKKK